MNSHITSWKKRLCIEVNTRMEVQTIMKKQLQNKVKESPTQKSRKEQKARSIILSGRGDDNLAAVISSQTVKQDNGDTSGKHDATIAKIDQHNSLAFTRRASPGFFPFSHSARMPKSSTGIKLFPYAKEVSFLFSEVSEFDEELTFFLESKPFKTVTM